MTEIYEMVEYNEEMYYTLGLWPSLEAALDAIRGKEPPELATNGAEEYFILEVRRRRWGFCGVGKTVYKKCWSDSYIEKDDEIRWVVESETRLEEEL